MWLGKYICVLALAMSVPSCPPTTEPADAGPPLDAGPSADAGAPCEPIPDAGVDGGVQSQPGPGIGISSGSGTVASPNFRVVVDVGGHTPTGATTSPNYRVSFGVPRTP